MLFFFNATATTEIYSLSLHDALPIYVLVFADARGHRLGVADQCGAGAAAHQTDAGPQVRADFEFVATPAVQLRHALLADRVHARKYLLRGGDRLVGDVLDQFVRRLPGICVGFANDDMQADSERKLSPARGGDGLHAIDLFGDLRRRLAPCQIFVDGIDGDTAAGVRRSAEIERRPRRLHRREQQGAVLDADVLTFHINSPAAEQVVVDVEEFSGDLQAPNMIDK